MATDSINRINKDGIKVTIVPSRLSSYATALRAHLSAAMSYVRLDEYGRAEVEIECIDEMTEIIREYIKYRLEEEGE